MSDDLSVEVSSCQRSEVMSELRGKVVAITGASSGIGEATARHLAAQGAKVVLGARRDDRLKTLAAELEKAGGEAEPLRLDVTRRDDVAAFVKRAQERFGRLDVLVSNAGLMPLSLLDELKVDEWDRMIDVNIRGVLHGIAAAFAFSCRRLRTFHKCRFGCRHKCRTDDCRLLWYQIRGPRHFRGSPARGWQQDSRHDD